MVPSAQTETPPSVDMRTMPRRYVDPAWTANVIELVSIDGFGNDAGSLAIDVMLPVAETLIVTSPRR